MDSRSQTRARSQQGFARTGVSSTRSRTMLDIVYVAGLIIIFVMIGLLAKGVEAL
ncbi:hypothetical protein [Tessaracoccus antarcticus]|uniref:hypothetical protein n=1 Tax=Tessaracoccus antarcticus TaxID=2479848 RepID=UPI00131480F3|nr:hypothetical protein [Tessaracoccus antarcticus]